MNTGSMHKGFMTFEPSPPMRFHAVAAGRRVSIRLRRGGTVEGVVRRRIERVSALVIDLGDGAEVIVMETATTGARVYPEHRA